MFSGETIRSIDKHGNLVAGFFGIFANVFLVFLLMSCHSTELKNYNKILLQIAAFDILNSISTAIVSPMAVVIEGFEFFFQNGPFKDIAQPWNHLIFITYQFLFFYSLSVVPVQFVLRYMLLCKNKKITKTFHALLLFIPACLTMVQTIIAWFCMYPNLNYSKSVAKVLSQYFKTNEPKELIISSGGERPFTNVIIANISGSILLTICYLTIFYYGYKINVFLKEFSYCFTPKTIQLQKNLNRVLFFQALSPIIFLLIPTMSFLIMGFAKLTTPSYFTLLLMPAAWPPFINAFFALMTLKPLRTKLFHFLNPTIPNISTVNSQRYFSS